MNKIDYGGGVELYISDINDACESDKSEFDRIITVCQDSIEDNISDEMQYDYFCMSDGPANEYGGDSSYEMFSEAADTLYNALHNNERVLIHCHMGRSRSVSVAVAALGRLLDLSRTEAFDVVKRYRPQAHPDTLLMGHASTYIEQHTNHSPIWSE